MNFKWPLFSDWRKQRELTADQATDDSEIGVVHGSRQYRMKLGALRTFLGALPTVLAEVVRFTVQTLTAVQRRQARSNIGAMQELRPGRTLTANSTITMADYGTVISLAGFRLDPGVGAAAFPGGVLGAQGVGTVRTSAHGDVTLDAHEAAIIYCLADGDTRVLASVIIRQRFTITDGTPPANPQPGDSWYDSSIGSRFLRISNAWVEEVTAQSQGFTNIINTAGAGYLVPAAAGNAYIRKSHTTGVAHTVTIQAADSDVYAYPANFVCTIRNESTSGNLTVQVAGGVYLTHASGRNVIPPREARQIIRTGLNAFDLI